MDSDDRHTHITASDTTSEGHFPETVEARKGRERYAKR